MTRALRLSDEELRRAGAMWRRGFDTAAIARELKLHEAVVASSSEAIRAAARGMRRAG